MRSAALALVALALGTAACGSDDPADGSGTGGGEGDGVAVSAAWARSTPPGTSVGAAYLRIVSDVGDELIGATVDPGIAAAATLHVTEVDAAGTSSMAEQAAIPLPAGEEVAFEPGGSHVMLVDLAAPLEAGERFDLTLDFADAPDLVGDVEVRDDAP